MVFLSLFIAKSVVVFSPPVACHENELNIVRRFIRGVYTNRNRWLRSFSQYFRHVEFCSVHWSLWHKKIENLNVLSNDYSRFSCRFHSRTLISVIRIESRKFEHGEKVKRFVETLWVLKTTWNFLLKSKVRTLSSDSVGDQCLIAFLSAPVKRHKIKVKIHNEDFQTNTLVESLRNSTLLTKNTEKSSRKKSKWNSSIEQFDSKTQIC